jgi:hypothetical protein
MRQWKDMKYTHRIALISASLVVLPLVSFAQVSSNSNYSASDPNAGSASSASGSSLQTQAQALLQQVAALQAQIAAAGGSSSGGQSSTVSNSSACPLIGRSLKVGSTGDDVSRLQQFLAQDPAIYPEATVSGYFGGLTEAAVRRWQVKFNIVSSGSPATTGYGMVGPRTAAAISLQCTQQSSQNNQANATQAGGYIQVTPVSGSAPLTVSVQAFVNTVNNCNAQVYTLDFGDGTQLQQIPTNGSCTQVTQNYSHTYTYGGSYQIVLASGAHRTSAIVTVSGATSQQQQQQTPPDSMRASITSGVAPLSVIFSGTVSSASGLGCQGTCNETINFGDGSVGMVALPTTPGTWQSYSITHTYSYAGTFNPVLQSVTGSTLSSPIAITVGPASTITTNNGSYGIISVTPTSGNPLQLTAVVSVPSCAVYSVTWGDSNTIQTVTNQCASGGGTVPNIPLTHTYAAGGGYDIVLRDAQGNSQAAAHYSIQ